MSRIVDIVKHKPANLLMLIAGHLPTLKRELKKLIRIKYFLSPEIHSKDIAYYLQLPFKRHPVIVYPQTQDKPVIRKQAIITGATSGIGKAFACHFARQGYDLLITGRRKEIIYGVAEEIKEKYAVNVKILIADLSANEDLSLLLHIIGMQNNIAVLVNNAGYGRNMNFGQDEIDHQLAMMKVHVNAPIMLIHKVLPQMIDNKEGIIINVSSLAAYFPTPGSAMYSSTKSFLKSFTESLYMEVRQYGIRVQCLCPGFTYSDFHCNMDISGNGLKQGLVRWMKPTAVVEHSVSCLNKGKAVSIPGVFNRMLILLITIFPRKLYYPMAIKLEKKIRRQKSIPDLAYV